MKSMMTNLSSKLQTIWSPHSLRKKQQVIWKGGGVFIPVAGCNFGYDLEECNKNKHVNKGEMFISFPSFYLGAFCAHTHTILEAQLKQMEAEKHAEIARASMQQVRVESGLVGYWVGDLPSPSKGPVLSRGTSERHIKTNPG